MANRKEASKGCRAHFRSRPAILGASIAALVGFCFVPGNAWGQTWIGETSSDWNTANNWTPATVPNSSSAAAVFGAADLTALSLSGNVEVGSVAFVASGTQPYTISVDPAFTLTISGSGITNAAPQVTETFVTETSGTSGASIIFTNSADAGSGVQFVNQGSTGGQSGQGGALTFESTATAGSAVITNQGDWSQAPGSVAGSSSGATHFTDTSDAGSALIINQTGFSPGTTVFSASSSANNATIINQGGTFTNALAGNTTFEDMSTAGSATIINNGSTATSAGGGTTLFLNFASAGSATIITNGGANGGAGGAVYFEDFSDGGTARAITNGNGIFDISGLSTSGMSIGSVEGSGTYYLGDKTLTVGGNNLSTTVSGVISDGGEFGEIGGSLVMTGTGTLTLAGANTYGGTTTINGGSILVNGSVASTAAVTVNNGGTLGGTGSIAGAVTVNSGGTLTHSGGNTAGTLTVGGLILNNGSNVNYELGTPGTAGGGVNDLTVVNGNLTLGGTLNLFALPGFGDGTYELFTYSGGLTGSSMNLGTLPTGYSAADFTFQTMGNEVELIVTGGPASTLQYWNGGVITANNAVNGGSGTWDNMTTNWTDSAGATTAAWGKNVAVFSAGTGTVTLGDNISAAELRFVSGAGSYTIAVEAGNTLTISGAGVTNTSSVSPVFVIGASDGSSSGTITFTNSASAGTAPAVGTQTLFTVNGSGSAFHGALNFTNTSTAGNATIINEGGTAPGGAGGVITFSDSSSAGSATIVNFGGSAQGGNNGATIFEGSASAGSAAFSNNGSGTALGMGGTTSFTGNSNADQAVLGNTGATVANGAGGSTNFSDNSSAGSATIFNNVATVSGGQGGSTNFSGTASANEAQITNQSSPSGFAGGSTTFSDSSTAGYAMITNYTGATLSFGDTASGGNAMIMNFGGSVSFQGNSTAGGATISNSGGTTTFTNSATAGGASITNAGTAAGETAGSTMFTGSSTAGGATIVNLGTTLAASATGGYTIFANSSTAQFATILNEGSTPSVSRISQGTLILGASGTTVFESTSAGNATIINQGASVSNDYGGVTLFTGGASAGSAVITNQAGVTSGANGGVTIFYSSSGGSATITNQGGAVGGGIGGITDFSSPDAGNPNTTDGSTTGNSKTITNQGASAASAYGGLTIFEDATLVGATLVNQGGTAMSAFGGATYVENFVSADGATFLNQPGTVSAGTGGYVIFFGSASAGDGTITNQGATISGAYGGATRFQDQTSAGSATITTTGGSNGGSGAATFFFDAADGGTAQAMTSGSGIFDISGLTDGGMNIGSIAGSGTYYLGSNTLTVGGNNLSTTVSGVVSDGGQAGGSGGSLVKVGTGALTLSGTNVYTGTTTVNGGSLIVDGAISSTSTVTVNGTATLAGTGTIAGTVIIQAGGTLSPGDSAGPGTLQVASLILNAGSISAFRLGQPDVIGGGVNDFVNITGALTLAGTIDITPLSGFASGTYSLFAYGGALTNDGITAINGIPNATVFIVTSEPGQVDLMVAAGSAQYWDGTGAGNDGVISGGNGTWNKTTSNWTNSTGTSNSSWQGGIAIFGGTASTVTIGSPISVQGLVFNTSEYVLSGSNALTLTGTAPYISANGGSVAIAAPIAGTAGLLANGVGTVILANGSNTYTGGSKVTEGVLQIGASTTAGSIGAGTISVYNFGEVALVNAKGNVLSNNVTNGIGGLGAVDIDSTNTNTLSGALTDGVFGQLELIQNGTGTTILTNPGNTYSGATVLSSGTLQIGTATAAGSIGANSEIGLSSGAKLSVVNVAGNTLANSISNTTGGSPAVIFNSTNTITMSGVMTGQIALSQTGTGTTVLTNNSNSLGGVTATVTAGTLQIGNGTTGNLASTNLTVTGSGSVALDLNSSGGQDMSAGVFLNGANTSIKAITPAGVEQTISGSISGTGTFNQNGAGTTILTVPETYTGATKVNAGTLEVDGSLAAASTVTVGTAGTLTGTGVINGKVTLTGNGTIDLNPGTIEGTLTVTGGNWEGAGTVEGAMTSSSGTFNVTGFLFEAGGLAVTGGTITGNGVIDGSLNYTSSATSTFAGTISDGQANGSVTMNKAGSTLILTGENSYSGATTISAGTLQLGDGVTAHSSVLNGAINVLGTGVLALDLATGETFSRSVTLGATGATLKMIQSGVTTVSGAMSGTGGFAQAGPGMTIVTGASTYSGATSVSAGVLQVDGALGGSGAVTVAVGGTLAGAASTPGTGTIAGAVTVLAGGTLSPGDGTGPGTLDLSKLTLSAGSNSDFRLSTAGTPGGGVNDLVAVSGNLTIAGNLNVTELAGFGIGSYTLFTYGGTLTNTGFTSINGTGGFDAVISTGSAHQVNLVISATATQFWDGTGKSNDGIISGGGGTWNGTNSNWTNSTGGPNSAWGGGTADFGTVGGTVMVGAPINVQGLIFGVTGYTLNGSATSPLNLVGSVTSVPTISVSAAGTSATIGAVIGGNAGVAANGLGTLILTNAANTYTGGTLITNGTVQIGASAAGSIGGGTISVATGGTLDVVNIHNNTLSNAVTNGVSGTGTLLVNSTLSNTLSGALSDGGAGQLALTQSGTGTTILTNGGNSYSGATTVNKGTLQIGTATAAGSIGAMSAVSVGGGATLSLVAVSGGVLGNNISSGSGAALVKGIGTQSVTLSGVLSNGAAGTLALTQSGTGTTILTAGNSYTGATTISAGTLQIGDGSTPGASLGATAVTVSGSGSLALDLATNETFATAVVLSGATSAFKSINVSGAEQTITGVISGTGAFDQNGPGGTVLSSGVNETYTGATNVNAGFLVVDGTLAAASTVHVGSLSGLFGNGTIKGNVTLTGGSIGLGSSGTIGGTLTVAGGEWTEDGTVVGATTVTSGALSIGLGPLGAVLTAKGGVNLAGGTLAGIGEVDGKVTDTSSGSFIFQGVIGDGSVPKSGAVVMNKASATMTLTGENTYTGGTTVTAGTLQLGVGNTPLASLGSGAVTIASGGTLALYLADTVTFSNPITDSGHLADVSFFAANFTTLASMISGTGSFAKTGTDTMALTGANTYSGGTTVSGGALLVNNTAGSGTGTGAVAVNNGGTLGGSGKVSGAMTLNSGGTIVPGAGNTLAETTLHGASLLWNGGSTISLELGASTGDELSLSGALTKGSTGSFTIDLLNEGITTQTSYTLLTFGSTTFSLSNFTLDLPTGFTGTLVETGTSLSITNLAAASGELPAEGGSLNLGGDAGDGSNAMNGNDGASLPLAGDTRGLEPGVGIVPTPEPGGATLLVLGAGTLLGWRRRRRR